MFHMTQGEARKAANRVLLTNSKLTLMVQNADINPANAAWARAELARRFDTERALTADRGKLADYPLAVDDDYQQLR